MSIENKHFTNISFSQWSVIVIPTVKIAYYSTDMKVDQSLALGVKFKTGRTWIFFQVT